MASTLGPTWGILALGSWEFPDFNGYPGLLEGGACENDLGQKACSISGAVSSRAWPERVNAGFQAGFRGAEDRGLSGWAIQAEAAATPTVALRPRCRPALHQSEQSKGAWCWGFPAPHRQPPATASPLTSSSVPTARPAESHVNSCEDYFLPPADPAFRLPEANEPHAPRKTRPAPHTARVSGSPATLPSQASGMGGVAGQDLSAPSCQPPQPGVSTPVAS